MELIDTRSAEEPKPETAKVEPKADKKTGK